LQSQGKKGKLYVIGTGPGDPELLTVRATKALNEADYILGHRKYIEMISGVIKGKKVIKSCMGKEVERVKLALELAKDSVVALVSGGDPSIYGIYSLVEEYVLKNDLSVEMEVIPGVTALCAASPLLGSPVSGDHAVISLSDLLTPWEEIERRLIHALRGGFVVVIYNPSSRKRKSNLIWAMEIVLRVRGDVYVGIVRDAFRDGESSMVMQVSEILKEPEIVDMSTILFVSGEETIFERGRMLTPRGYAGKYSLQV
jgi:precorrin-3B C17-methyltransferase